MFFRKTQIATERPLAGELRRLVDVWPELSERTRFGLLMLSSANLLKNAKFRAGFSALGSGLRYQGALIWRDTRLGIQRAGRRLAAFLRT